MKYWTATKKFQLLKIRVSKPNLVTVFSLDINNIGIPRATLNYVT